MSVAGPRMQAAERANVDDAAARGAKIRQNLAGNQKRAAGVGLEHRVPLLERKALQGG